MSGGHALALAGTAPDVASYDHVLVFTSGGKDSIASLIALLEVGADPARIELHHHEVDGRGPVFMDWPVTPAYCRALAAAFGLPILFSWREGGLLREMLRDGTPTAPVGFETPDGGTVTVTVGGHGPPGRRLRFPQVSADLSVRWCSAVAKVDVCRTLICNQARFLGRRVLVVTGERAQESMARARYARFEPHRTDTRGGARRPRHVDHWRPVHGWREEQVWDAMRRHGIVPHVAYQLGFGRLSCMSCIFMSSAQAASVRHMAPHLFRPLAVLEQRFGCTIKRGISLDALADRGRPYAPVLTRPDLVQLALSKTWDVPIRVDPRTWELPAGAHSDTAGPS